MKKIIIFLIATVAMLSCKKDIEKCYNCEAEAHGSIIHAHYMCGDDTLSLPKVYADGVTKLDWKCERVK